MKDPYILEDGTLKNLLGITSYQELKKAEVDIAYLKLMNIGDVINENISTMETFKNIHKHIFEDIFEWAGEFRTVPLYKEEVVIPGISLNYTEPKDIDKLLSKQFAEFDKINWKELKIEDVPSILTKNLSKIWRVHPFRDGNTRTTLAFAYLTCLQHGINMDFGKILNQLNRIIDPKTNRIIQYNVRDKFVLASLDERDYPEPEHLENVFKQAIVKEKNIKLEADIDKCVDKEKEEFERD